VGGAILLLRDPATFELPQATHPGTQVHGVIVTHSAAEGARRGAERAYATIV